MKIDLKPGQQLFFTSDTHYSHSNICRATTTWNNSDNLTRDFKSLEHMNSVIVDNINDRVGQDDILIHLGDWSFGGFDKIAEFRNKIMCENVHLVYGNHDHHIMNNRENIQDLFSTTQPILWNLEIRKQITKQHVEKFMFVCFHFPIASWENMNKGVMHLHGHVHLPSHHKLGDGKSLDVGVDGNNLKPYSLNEIINLLKDQPIKKLTLPKDHHETRV